MSASLTILRADSASRCNQPFESAISLRKYALRKGAKHRHPHFWFKRGNAGNSEVSLQGRDSSWAATEDCRRVVMQDMNPSLYFGEPHLGRSGLASGLVSRSTSCFIRRAGESVSAFLRHQVSCRVPALYRILSLAQPGDVATQDPRFCLVCHF